MSHVRSLRQKRLQSSLYQRAVSPRDAVRGKVTTVACRPSPVDCRQTTIQQTENTHTTSWHRHTHFSRGQTRTHPQLAPPLASRSLFPAIRLSGRLVVCKRFGCALSVVDRKRLAGCAKEMCHATADNILALALFCSVCGIHVIKNLGLFARQPINSGEIPAQPHKIRPHNRDAGVTAFC